MKLIGSGVSYCSLLIDIISPKWQEFAVSNDVKTPEDFF